MSLAHDNDDGPLIVCDRCHRRAILGAQALRQWRTADTHHLASRDHCPLCVDSINRRSDRAVSAVLLTALVAGCLWGIAGFPGWL